MAWRDELQTASFRGASFVASSGGGALGRRTARHEFPQRDKPWTEDIGRRTREFRVAGYVAGSDYMAARDAILRAVELPGPGRLVHPWHGEMDVVCEDHTYEETAENGGMASFQFVFVEAGELTFPRELAGVALVDQVADLVMLASILDFLSIFDLLLLPGDLLLAGLDAARSLVNGIRKAIFGPAWKLLAQFDVIGATLDALERDLQQLIDEPGKLADRFADVFGLVGDTATATAVLGTVTSADESAIAVEPTGTPLQQQAQTNERALTALVRRGALVALTRAVVREEPASYDDAVAARDRLAALVTAEAEAVSPATLAGDELFAALLDLRTAVVEAITDASADLARLRTVTPVDVVPALVLAWDLYGDPSREQELVDRNRVAHPAFVPSAPLRVLEA